jgi:hypothetical protein
VIYPHRESSGTQDNRHLVSNLYLLNEHIGKVNQQIGPKKRFLRITNNTNFILAHLASASLRKNHVVAAILIYEAIRGSESLWRSYETFAVSASAFRGLEMLHMDNQIIHRFEPGLASEHFAGTSRGPQRSQLKRLCEAILGSKERARLHLVRTANVWQDWYMSGNLSQMRGET